MTMGEINSKNAKPFWPRVRGRAVIVAVGVSFVLADLYQRAVIVGLIRLFPSRRDRILTNWIRRMTRFSVSVLVEGVAGARIAPPPELPNAPGTIILMNHQSILDIPLAVLAVEESYPVVVARRSYARRIPLVSFLLRFCQFPLVEPGQRGNGQLEMLEEVARTADRPILIFPEGHRSRDGQLRPFRSAGTEAMLNTGEWNVYALVVDGFWRCGKLRDFSDEIGFVRSRITALGPYPFDSEIDDALEFLRSMHERMGAALVELREDGPRE
jgi:1-acyl-sn-glycerol-3-phosphate acyltransferase